LDPASLLIAITAAVAATMGPLALHLAIRRMRLRQVALLGLAGELDGKHIPGGVFGPGAVQLHRPEGTILVRKPEATSPDAAWPLALELQLHTPLPQLCIRPGWQYYGVVGALKGQDIQVGHPALDQDFRIEGRDAEAVPLAIGGEVVPHILALARVKSLGDLKIEVEPLGEREGCLLRVCRGVWPERIDRVRDHVDATCALGQALVDRWLAPWADPAARWGLQLEQQRISPLHNMVGTVDGLALRVHQAVDQGRKVTRIRIAMSTLGGLRMAHKEHARDAGWLPLAVPIGNPVLDMLLAVKAYQLDRVRALLADEELTADLLEVLHGRPGSELNQQGLTLELPGHLQPDLQGPIEQALALARQLRARLAAIDAGAGAAPR
jgi:hypothetical protein